jgi:TPP-dependent pyruvate/acetoin dehydrogenase alpha subunit
MKPGDLVAFEIAVSEAFKARRIPGPIHLSGGNEKPLITLFKGINRGDWVFSTYRSHYHALLHMVPKDAVMAQIMAGRSMNLSFPEHRFFSSAIVGGCLPIAVGVAAGIARRRGRERVWCFVGDMAASIGAFHDAVQYSAGHVLPIQFVVEDNGLACDTPTEATWGAAHTRRITGPNVTRYKYQRAWPHVGTGEWVQF